MYENLILESLGRPIANRILTVSREHGGSGPVEVIVGSPVWVQPEGQLRGGFLCAGRIIGLSARERNEMAMGVDALQSLILLLSTLGVALCLSPESAQGRLAWGEVGPPFGFPLQPSLRKAFADDGLIDCTQD